VTVADAPVLLYRDGAEISAIGAVCSHAGGPLDEGSTEDHCVRCPWHDSVFDLRDGSVVHGPATYPEPGFDVRERDGQIELRRRPDRSP
jgi:nitrite reductase/ring-hydroxylating ferredoxin subunit